MVYIRKRHWVKYRSDKCKMYLRNDFHFECAYCGMRETDNVSGEEDFEKDHFVARFSDSDMDLDAYDNLVYACRKCNGTKSNQNLSLVLNPCLDEIYEGENRHIRKTGVENQYRLQPLTEKGKLFIDSLQLNSRFYRKVRKGQDQNDKLRNQILALLDENVAAGDSKREAIKEDIKKRIDEYSDEFRCGTSTAGDVLYSALQILEQKQIPYKLLFDNDDLDVMIQFEGNSYYCEFKWNDYIGDSPQGPRIDAEKKKLWLTDGKKCGILYYYTKRDVLDLYICSEADVLQKYSLYTGKN